MRPILLALVLGLLAVGTPAMAVEEPKYTVTLHDGAFEVRDYPPTVVAEVTVTGNQPSAVSRGFRLLAGYIFGGNTRHQSIAMTAPVAQERASEKIAMTAPVSQTPSGGAWVVRFTMPSAYSLETLPIPNDPNVKLRPIAAARYAVVRYSGIANQANFDAKAAALMDFIKAHHLHPTGPATLAQYDPPWTLWFMRRNEVLIPVEAG